MWILTAICFLFQNSFLIPFSFADEILVIANKDVSANSLTAEELKSIFLGEKAKWDDGRSIVFVLLLTEVHEDFLKKYLEITSSQYSQYWKKMIFTGRSKSPKSFVNPEELIGYIAATGGSVAYIPSQAKNDKVKTISIK
jgi:hypothetical protein